MNSDRMAGEYLVVRILRVSCLDNDKSHEIRVSFGAMSTKETARPICFELSSHGRMFNRLEVAMTFLHVDS